MTGNGSGRGAGTSANEQGPTAGIRPTEDRPVLAINPVGDRAFAAAAEALLDEGMRSLTSFQEALHQGFPNAVVRARDLSGEADAVWYVFRDGHWVNGQGRNEPVIDG